VVTHTPDCDLLSELLTRVLCDRKGINSEVVYVITETSGNEDSLLAQATAVSDL